MERAESLVNLTNVLAQGEIAGIAMEILGYDIGDEIRAKLEKLWNDKRERAAEVARGLGAGAQPTDAAGAERPLSERENPEMRADLERWRSKAKKRIERKGLAACDFASEHIPGTLNAAITGALETVTEPADVDKIFTDAKRRLIWIGYP